MIAGWRALPVWLAASVLSMSVSVYAADEADVTAEIDYLLAEVGASRCVFIRNGREHNARAAREHLASKRRRGRRYFDTTEEFIDRLASKSSMSGKAYLIRCGDETVAAKAWFTSRLDAYRKRAPAKTSTGS